MAFTKITFGDTEDTVRSAFDKVNDIIDDLASTTSGLGASQIGIADSGSLITGTNVETALAENRTAINLNTAKVHTQGTDTTLGTMTGDIAMGGSYQVTGLQAPAASGEAIRQTTNVTEANLETLTDNSIANTLHRHSELVASDGAPDPALSVDATGQVGIGTATPSNLLDIEAASPVIHDINATATITGGQDSSAKLLIHADGVDGATTYTAETGQTVTFAADAQIDTAQAEFGVSSILFDGTGDYISVPDSADWAFGDFTIDLWVRFNAITAIAGQYTIGTTTPRWTMYGEGTALKFAYHDGVSWKIAIAGATVLGTGTWYHVALVRSGDDFTLYLNGGQEATVNYAAGTINLDSPLCFGWNGSGAEFLNGHLDEIRVSNIARWTAPFTPPTSAYSTAATALAYTQYQSNSETKSVIGWNGTTETFNLGISSISSPMLSITLAGNVGINTTTPGGKFCVNGGVTIGSDTDAGDNNLRVEGTSTVIGEITAPQVNGLSAPDAAGEAIRQTATITEAALETAIGASGGIATDPIWAAAGDLAVGTGNDTAAVLSIGAAGALFGVNDASALGYKSAKISDAGAMTGVISITGLTTPLTKAQGGSGTTGDSIIKAWCQFEGEGCNLQDSFNVSSITDTGTGDYTVNWDTDFANNDYAVVASGAGDNNTRLISTGAIATGTCRLTCVNATNSNYADATFATVIAIGDQA